MHPIALRTTRDEGRRARWGLLTALALTMLLVVLEVGRAGSTSVVADSAAAPVATIGVRDASVSHAGVRPMPSLRTLSSCPRDRQP